MESQDEAYEALGRWKAIVRPIEQLNARIENELTLRHSLCITGYEVLYLLASQRGRTPLTQLCKDIDRSQPRVSRLVSQLEERGMVERHRADSDGRAYQIAITRKGRRALHASADTLLGILEEQDMPGGPGGTSHAKDKQAIGKA
ncbi:winged helix-turn-helix transcriptional regulator [Streptomyces sp. NA04227]|uniref:MarR family winged helix-turn-helix transcriptional regulator n=1 Tax=Streptomyces sp. NA04227 TaxID=2742136 RepID=UPI0015911FAA|nr:MarR family winged helix-turn-helix transcriptional regulator [Streptomyces sp. NA04227]QKW09786.1 winged helix-turn-helix transcriptional regulator [Streptomyces sp. NA04227]